jgi:hypothetical protein
MSANLSATTAGDAAARQPLCAGDHCNPVAARLGVTGPSVGLSYIDLLYALPVAAVATQLAALMTSAPTSSSVSKSGWANVVVAVTAVTCGWVGHHGNRKRLPVCLKQQEERWFFTTPRFVQFVLEILIIAVYFALAVITGIPHPALSGRPTELRYAQWLAAAFWLYFFWDLLDIYIASRSWNRGRSNGCAFRGQWSRRAVKGMVVTACFMAIFTILCAYIWSGRHFTPHIVLFDLLLVVLLLSYRATQELVGGGGLHARRNYLAPEDAA